MVHIVVAEPNCFSVLPRVTSIRAVLVAPHGTFKYVIRWEGYETQDCVVTEEVLHEHLQRLPFELPRFLTPEISVETRKAHGALFEITSLPRPSLGTFVEKLQVHALEGEVRSVSLLDIPGVVVHPSYASAADEYHTEVAFITGKLHQQLMGTTGHSLTIVTTVAETRYDALRQRLLATDMYSSVDIIHDGSLSETGLSGIVRDAEAQFTGATLVQRNRRSKVVCECPHCGMSFWDATGLQSHIESRGSHRCPCCPLTFCYEAHLSQHIRMKHIVCKWHGCKGVYRDREEWNSHLFREKNYPLTCFCLQKFQNPRNYYDHCKAVHPGGKWAVAIVTKKFFCADLETSVRTELAGREIFVMCCACAQLVKVPAPPKQKVSHPLELFTPSGCPGMDPFVLEALVRHRTACSGRIPLHFEPQRSDAEEAAATN